MQCADNEDYVNYGMDRKQRTVLIAGPTASGKSALALALAERDGGVVINADASQVYGCWRILTARPDAADEARAPHRLYGHVASATAYSVGHWLRDVNAVLAEAERAGRRAIIVGGTGRYFHALTRGLARIPPIPPEVRSRSQAMDIEAMRAALDPETAARIDLRNPMRVQRAWEALVATGRGLASWQRETDVPIVPVASAACIVLEIEKDLLNINIERRFHGMLEQGALDEVRAFTDWNSPAAQVIGATELHRYIAGEVSLPQATASAVTATRQFAKRQRTWFRGKMEGWERMDGRTALDAVARL
jgi:tRNA dimethylallyltransferase